MNTDIESGNESMHRRAASRPAAYHTIALWQPEGRKIHKVPELLRQEEQNNAYDPMVVSFGPYHYGKPELQRCQDAKHLALLIFVEGSGHSPKFFYDKVLDLIKDAKECYMDSMDCYSDEDFAAMMLLDACFLIWYIYIGTQISPNSVKLYKYLGRMDFSLVYRDILLVENQIPYQIVMHLVKMRYNEDGGKIVSKLLHTSIWGQHKEEISEEINQRQKQHLPLTLFEAFRIVLVWDRTPSENQAPHEEQSEEETDMKKSYKTFRSAKDLKAKGIHFRPSESKSLKAIDFKSFTFYGQLELPTWFVSSLSRVCFLNMIAYELCPGNRVDHTVITYVSFMKSLIDSPADVKELREKRILLTSLGCDEEVVRLYRDLNTHGMDDTGSFKLVKQKIQKHYDSLAKTWMAELIHIYFSSPWSILAWVAGLLLLILTMIQTYFTVKPSK